MSTIALFQQQEIRRLRHDEQWYFVLEDIIVALTDSQDPKQYIKRLKLRDAILSKGWVQIVPTLWIDTLGGRQKMRCVNTTGVLRIIQSIPSPKAEPFKLRLAEVGSERIQEINNPEIAMQRMRDLYLQKGYPEDWIDLRTRSISVRQELTDEWKQRGAKEGLDYAILTNEISKAAFGMTVQEYLDHKGLDKKKHNLRDHQDIVSCI